MLSIYIDTAVFKWLPEILKNFLVWNVHIFDSVCGDLMIQHTIADGMIIPLSRKRNKSNELIISNKQNLTLEY
jgi:hypothetical protein